MKRIYIILLGILFLMPFRVSASGGFNVSNSSISMHIGESKTINIISDNSVGKLNILSSNTGVASTNVNTTFIETPGSSKSITITANSVGNTTISIVATSDYGTMDEEALEGLTKTITVNVIAAVSNNAKLNSLSINTGSLSPSFSPGVTTYSSSTYDSSVTINASTSDTKASVSGTGTKSLSVGNNLFKLTVVAEDGTKKEYSITITRNKKEETPAPTKTEPTPVPNTKSETTKSSINTLKKLEIEGIDLKFKSDTFAYSTVVENNMEEIDINAETTDSKARIDGIGKQKVNIGNNVYKINVVAENGDKKTYAITIVRKDKNGTTSGLSNINDLRILNIKGYSIDFNKNKTKYILNVANSVKEVNIEAGVENDKSTVTGTGIVQLKTGINKIELIVTAENGDKKIYTVIINKNNEINTNEKKNNSLLIPIVIMIFLLFTIIGALFYIIKKKINTKSEIPITKINNTTLKDKIGGTVATWENQKSNDKDNVEKTIISENNSKVQDSNTQHEEEILDFK